MSIKDQYKQEREQLQMLLDEMGEMLGSQSGFVQRKSKLGAKELVQILSLGCLETGKATLESFCQVAQDLEICLSAPGLHQRLNMEAVELLRQVCHLWMQQGIPQERFRDVLVNFGAVRIFDSSRIPMPSRLVEQFAGSRNGATMKVQLAYEYHSGQIQALEVEAGRVPDQTCQLPQALSQAGDLALFDLGYFDQDRFAELSGQGAYFLSRLQSQVGLYQLDEPQTKVAILDDLTALDPQICSGEVPLLLGGRKKVPVRVIYYRLPADVVQQRRRKAKQDAKKRGKTCSQHALDWLDWLIFITNVPAHWLSVEQVAIVYRLRWQIEILFKVWKQEMDWGIMGNWRIERILCQFYARCLALLLFHRLLEKYQGDCHLELSWQKAIRILKRKSASLITIVRQHFHGLLAFLQRFDRDIRRFALKSSRRTSLSTYALLKLVRA